MEFHDRRAPSKRPRTTAGLMKGTANGHGYAGETSWASQDGRVAFIADGRPSGAAVLHASPRGRISISSHPHLRYDEQWEADSIAHGRHHEQV